MHVNNVALQLDLHVSDPSQSAAKRKLGWRTAAPTTDRPCGKIERLGCTAERWFEGVLVQKSIGFMNRSLAGPAELLVQRLSLETQSIHRKLLLDCRSSSVAEEMPEIFRSTGVLDSGYQMEIPCRGYRNCSRPQDDPL